MRALVLVLNGVGIGNAPDAEKYGDLGADTLGHIFKHRQTLSLPNLFSLGLRRIVSGTASEPPSPGLRACYGRMREHALGKDATAGLWEIAGVVAVEPLVIFEKFPKELVEAIERDARVDFLGNCRQIGDDIPTELIEEHFKSKRPILFNSTDSIMQIAAHESVVPVPKLYQICRVARHHCNTFRIGRVIARPFTGGKDGFVFTNRRHDFSILPPRTVLNALSDAGLAVHGVGKIPEIFAHSGITCSHHAATNREGFRIIEELWPGAQDGLIFANLLDFDTFGHNRDLQGFARTLEEFDAWLGGFLSQVENEDLVIITANHGNDPAFRGSSHTREEVPLMAIHNEKTGPLGTRDTLADVAATLAAYFELDEKWPSGKPFLDFSSKQTLPYPYRR